MADQFDREDVEAVVACLGDDAAQLRQENDEDERADNMDRAASMLTWMLLTHPAYTAGVTVTNAWKAEQPITNAPRSISEPTAGVALPAAPIQLSAIESALFDALVSWHEISGIPADPAELERLASYLTVAVIESDPAPAGVKGLGDGR